MGLSGSSLNRALAFAGVVATAMAAGAFSISAHYTHDYRLSSALAVARQVASQSESLYGEARERGEKDPLGWVVLQLSRGEEPRVVRVSRIVRMDRSPAGEDEREQSELNEREGFLDYSKHFVFDPATGVRIIVSAPFIGFLGTQSRALSDLFVFLAWACFFGLSFGAFRAWDEEILSVDGPIQLEEGDFASEEDREFDFPKTALPPPVVPITPPAPIPMPAAGLSAGPDREKLTESLRETARSIKGLFEGTVNFARSLAEVNGHVATVRKSLHTSLTDANRDGRKLEEWITTLRAAETEGMNGVASMAKIREHFLQKGFAPDSPEMRAMGEMASRYERIAHLLYEGRAYSEKVRERVMAIELSFEPLSADADLAAQACERAFAASGEIDLATVAVQRRIVEHSHLIKQEAEAG